MALSMYYTLAPYQEIKQMKQNTYTKESIKARMFKRVASLWDIRNTELLDPVVKLLIEVLASEIFKLSGNLDDVQDNVAEKLASTFIPAHMLSASPAHAIVHARAAEGCYHIAPNVEFVYKDPHFTQKHNLRKVSFTPTGVVPVINGDVAAMICQGKYFEITPKGGREHVANCTGKGLSDAHTMWLGLEISKEVENLNGVSFYFDFPLLGSNEDYLRMIKHSKWYCGDMQIQVIPGPYRISSGEGIFGLFDQRQYLNNEVAGKYSSHFITIDESTEIKGLPRKAVHPETEHLFDEETIKDLREDLLWLKVEFPPAFDHTAMSQLCIHINCFPIENVYKKLSVVTTNRFSSIVPIEKENNEYFLFMDSVNDSQNNIYKQVQNHNDNIAGTYMIRRGGAERYNSLNARDFLERLLDLYRDESIAFSGIDSDITSTASGLMQHLSDLELKLESYDNDSEHAAYLVLGSDMSTRTNLSMSYCLTNGGIANGIHAGKILEVPAISDLNTSGIVLMTQTRSGRKSPPESSRKDIYRYLLATRDRVYTKDDIKMYCHSYYGDCFSTVAVENAYEVSSEPGQGFIKVIKVILAGALEKSPVDTKLLKKDVLAGLKQRSPDDFEYRIVVS